MNASVEDWIAKAEGDFDVALLVLDAKLRPNYDAVCFHCQQCVEKLLKSLLLQLGVKPPRVHDLVVLSELASGKQPTWVPEEKELRFLTQAAIMFRYPGESATREKAQVAVSVCRRLRETLLKLITDAAGPRSQ